MDAAIEANAADRNITDGSLAVWFSIALVILPSWCL